MPPLDTAEWKTVMGNVRSRDPVFVRLRRTVYMREVNKADDDRLKILMKLPNGVEIVDAFGEGSAQGQQIAARSLQSPVPNSAMNSAEFSSSNVVSTSLLHPVTKRRYRQ